MNKSRRNASPTIALLVVAMLFAGGTLVGCSSASQDELADAPPAVPEQASKPLPEGYPGSVAPIYEPSKVTHVFTVGSGAMLKYMITAEASDSVDVVAATLADDYKSRGANVSETPVDEAGTGQVVASKDGYGIVITYTAGEQPGTTSITYDVHKQRGSR